MAPRTVYMLAGSLATVAVLAVLVTHAPKFFRTNAQEQPPVTVQEPVPVLPQQTPPATTEPVAVPPAATPVPAPVATRPAGSAPTQPAGRPVDNQPAAPVATPAPPPVAVVPAPLQPAVPTVDRTALEEQRRRVIQMAQRIVTAKAALQSLLESMAQQGLRPRAELQGFQQRMQFEMDQGEAALNSNNPAQARQHLDYAERALESLEKALNL
jgi:hypothetical protein